MDEQANHVFCIVAFQETQIFSFCAHCWVCLPSRSVSLWGKRLYENDTAMWHGDHLFPHSLGRVMSHPIMVHQHWELSRPWQTEMNLDVVIRSGISFNRLHFIVMWPVPCRSMCTYPLSLTHISLSTQTHNRKQTRTCPPTLIKTLSFPITPSLSITLSLTCRFITILHYGVCLLLCTCVSSLMGFGDSLSDTSVCLGIKESDGLMLTAP